MAAIDLSEANSVPWVYSATAVDTTWQEFSLPTWVDVVVLTFEGEAGYFAFAENGVVATPESPADGGAVGTHRMPVAADAAFAVPITGTGGRSSSLFVARASTSGVVTLLLVRGNS